MRKSKCKCIIEPIFQTNLLGRVISKESDGGSTVMALDFLSQQPIELVEVADVALCYFSQ